MNAIVAIYVLSLIGLFFSHLNIRLNHPKHWEGSKEGIRMGWKFAPGGIFLGIFLVLLLAPLLVISEAINITLLAWRGESE